VIRTPSIVIIVVYLAVSTVFGQKLARTPDGKPDLQGLWLNNTATPLERPAEFAGKAFLSDAEAREYLERYQLDRTAAASRVDPTFELDVAADLDTYEPGPLLPGRRTSLITEPDTGRVPALTPEAQLRAAGQAQRVRSRNAENPEDFTNAERCLQVAQTSAPPMLPAYYNNNLQIVQTRDYVMILSEMIHDVRIIPLARAAHLPSAIGQWKGDSIGRWEGDTLVVDTTNFTDKTNLRGSGPGLHVVERFALHGPDALKYEFAVDDPESFVRSWSGDSLMTRSQERMFEYACHEANYSLPIMMRGERFQEGELGGTKSQKPVER